MNDYTQTEMLGRELTEKVLEEYSDEIDEIIRAQIENIAASSSFDYGIPNVRKRVANLSDEDFQIVKEVFIAEFFDNIFEINNGWSGKNAESTLSDALDAVDAAHGKLAPYYQEHEEID